MSIFCVQGYLNNEAATRHTITEDGWFKTGDVAIRDKEGHFFIVDRVKELIKYKGFQGKLPILTFLLRVIQLDFLQSLPPSWKVFC